MVPRSTWTVRSALQVGLREKSSMELFFPLSPCRLRRYKGRPALLQAGFNYMVTSR